MRRVILLFVVIFVSILIIPQPVNERLMAANDSSLRPAQYIDYFSSSSAGDLGISLDAMMYSSRLITSLNAKVQNSYASVSQHVAKIDLTQYQEPGWNLYKAVISSNQITAIAERETTGITPNSYLQIYNNSGLVSDALYQQFYGQPHDGKLENYTIMYIAPYYSTSLGKAFLVVRGDYSDPGTNETGWISPFSQVLDDTIASHDCSADGAILAESTPYYVVIDGTAMTGYYAGNWYFNNIYWASSSSILGVETGYHLRDDTWYQYTGISRQEAYLNYTYTPWNTTSDSPLQYSNPEVISLAANSSSLLGNSWTFVDSENLYSIEFTSNQSIDISYDMTLWYKKSESVSTSWFVEASSQPIQWNATISLSYLPTSNYNYLNLTIPNSWSTIGLYNSTTPSTNYTHYDIIDSLVNCYDMTNGTWTLVSEGFNYVTDFGIFETSTGFDIGRFTGITNELEMNSTIRDSASNPALTGSTNLTIWKDGILNYAPENKTVVDGLTSYTWDIDTTTSEHGNYRIEVFWSNGTDAGYLTRSIVIYYPTELTANQYEIYDYTDDSFDIQVFFNDTFTWQGLDGTYASVQYSFNGGSNTSMTDHSNGTWSATVDTTGINPGIYNLEVFAEGLALENQSIIVTVNLIHETQALTVQWSNGDNITYVESSQLQVTYRRTNGNNITGATVNVTIGSNTWALNWNELGQYYYILFNGTDSPPGFGTYSLSISAWKADYQFQVDTTQTLTLREEPTSLVIAWSNTNDITFVQSTTLRVNYRMSNGTPISDATLNVTIGGTLWSLIWNDGLEVYERLFLGSDEPPGLGTEIVSILASKFGYESLADSSNSLTLREEPTSILIHWSSGSVISFVQNTVLSANFTMSNGTAIVGAALNVSINGDYWILMWDPLSKTYNHTFLGSDDPPGIGSHSLTIRADKFGYVEQVISTETLEINEEQTLLSIEWINSSSITYVEMTTLSANYSMSDGSPVVGATLNVTINSVTFSLLWNSMSQTYTHVFKGSDDPPGFGTHSMVILADMFGFLYQSNDTEVLTIQLESTNMAISLAPDNDITYTEFSTLIAVYTMSNGSPVASAIVNVTIGTDVWTLLWNGASEDYRIQINGTDAPPGFGLHSLVVRGGRFGYVGQTNSSLTVTLREEPTILSFQWSNTNNISYVDSTVLQVTYTMTNGTPISSATVNVTISGTTWPLNWNGGSGFFEVQFEGSDNPPGLGTYSITVVADYFGYVSQSNSPETLTLREEFTTLQINWSSGSTISFVESTILSISYRMSNGTAISGAEANVTIGGTTWTLVWDPISRTYNHTFNGMDSPPGLGTNSVQISSDRFGFEAQLDTSETLTIQEESTTLRFQWSATNTITYVEETTLSATYVMSNSTPITDAQLNVTIASTTLTLVWNVSSLAYEYTFSGSDVPPGFGTHSITVQADKFGYVSRINSSEYLTIQLEGTSLALSLTPDNDITFTEFSTLVVDYTMSNGTAVRNALVNVTIGGSTWILLWDNGNLDYRLQFNGTDDPPGFGTFTLVVRSGLLGFVQQMNSSQEITFRVEPTIFSIQWSNTNSIGYFDYTVLQIGYKMTNGTSISEATVNVTIDTTTWLLSWNSSSGFFEKRFYGSDTPPGVGTHSLDIQAGLFGYQSQVNTTQTLTLPVIPTSLVITWTNGFNITYVQSTTLIANYTMFNGTAIAGAVVNVTFGSTTWNLIWDSIDKIYSVTFNGNEDPPGLNTFSLDIRASKPDFEGVIDSSETLIVREEPTSNTIAWSAGLNITFVETTTLSIKYMMSNGTEIPDAIVNVTTAATTWILLWNTANSDYRITFNGTDIPPGFGTHSLTIMADKFGYFAFVDTNQELVLREEETNYLLSWNAIYNNNITYLESTILSLGFTMSNGTPVTNAVVNVTIDTTTLSMLWNSSSETYEIRFNGSDVFPGFGTHPLYLTASKFGYVSITDSSEELTIRVEDTSFHISWIDSSSISYVDSTILRIEYLLRNGTQVSNAIINITIDSTTWQITWNEGSGYYEIVFNGSDALPGLGTHYPAINAWRVNYQPQVDNSQTLVINQENTSITISWSDGTSITYVQQTTLSINYTMSNGTEIPGAIVNITIGSDTWLLYWDAIDEVYMIQINGTDTLPGLGIHGLSIKAWKYGYQAQADNSQVLSITGELGVIESTWLYGGTISYIGFTVLSVNYTMSNGTAISLATVNVTINSITWDLPWEEVSGTYRIRFNGTDALLGLGTHSLDIKAWRDGFDYQRDTTMTLVIADELTTLNPSWTLPYLGNISYFQYTTLRADYRMSNGSDILDATVNVTVSGTTFSMYYNSSSGFYEVQFNGSDIPPGLGTHSLVIRADLYGFQALVDSSQELVMRKDPTSIEVSWPWGWNITYVESAKVVVYYRMSNGSSISGATVNITIIGQTWTLVWNSTSEGYERIFSGADNPPGLDDFYPTIKAQRDVFVEQIIGTRLVINREPTTATPNWWTNSFYYTQSSVFSVQFRNSYGSLITGATQKVLIVNGSQYTLSESSGTYWYQFDYRMGLGYHVVSVNISKAGYVFSYINSIHFNISQTPTSLIITWDSRSIDYLGQANMTANYLDDLAARNVPTGSTVANITFDGTTPIPLTLVGTLWVANLTGFDLDLGTHVIVVKAWAYGYEYQEYNTTIDVSEVSTNPLQMTWQPTNGTIQYTQSLNLTVDYTFYNGDVPESAIVNITIDGTTYDLAYSSGEWRISLLGSVLEIGVYEAYISAWLYGYQSQTNTTYNVNVTLASNSFIVSWTPTDGNIIILENMNVSVVYTSDYLPIIDASVSISLNGSRVYSLVYNPLDEKWHISLSGTEIALGLWNATVVANRTGHEIGTEWKLISVFRDNLSVLTNWTSNSIDYISSVPLGISCNSSFNQPVDDATISVMIVGATFDVVAYGPGRYSTIIGPLILPGIYEVNITISGAWFYTEEITLTLTVYEASTNYDLDYPSATIFYDGYFSATISYTLLNGTSVPSASLTVLVDGNPITPSWGGSNWSLNLAGWILGTGIHNCSINMTSIGFEMQYSEFSVEVNAIPTVASYYGRTWMYVNDTLDILAFIDDARNSSHVTAESVYIDWLGNHDYTILPNQTVSIQIDSSEMHSGSYLLNVSLSIQGYDSAFVQVLIEIRLLTLMMQTAESISQYEREQTQLSVELVDEYHNNIVSWGTVVATILGTDYSLVYDHELDLYILNYTIPEEMNPGLYAIHLQATATDFLIAARNVSLEVTAKLYYEIRLSVPENITAGNSISLEALLIHSSTPISGRNISIAITFLLSNGTQLNTVMEGTTDISGIFLIQIRIPQDATDLYVTSNFEGSVEAWPYTSDILHREILSSGTTPSEPLISEPVTLVLIAGGISGFALIVVLKRRRGIHARAASSSPIPKDLKSIDVKGVPEPVKYVLSSDGRVRIPDMLETLSEFLQISDEELARFETALLSLGIGTFTGVAVRKQEKRKKDPASVNLPELAEIIKSAPLGLTRNEIANKLGISESKVWPILKELLESDSQFEEVAEGRTRKIRFAA